jgi:hypothetical protein
MQVDALLWETRHSTKDAPRVRLVIRLSRRLGRDSYQSAHRSFVKELAARVRSGLVVDGTSSRPEQPQFTPPGHSKIRRFVGSAYRPPMRSAESSVGSRMLNLDESMQRNVDLTSIAGTLRNRGLNQRELEGALSGVSSTLHRPLPLEEIRAISRSIASKPSARVSVPRIQLRSAHEVVNQPVHARWLLKPYLEENVVAVLTGDYPSFTWRRIRQGMGQPLLDALHCAHPRPRDSLSQICCWNDLRSTSRCSRLCDRLASLGNPGPRGSLGLASSSYSYGLSAGSNLGVGIKLETSTQLRPADRP